MQITVIHSLDQVSAGEWNALAGNTNPFLRHEFLHALEATGCTTPDTGWSPRHLLLRADQDNGGSLLGAVPLYLKNHSYGEYVFDWAWADAYARAGLHYYPKLVSAIPFSPVTGTRLLMAADADHKLIGEQLIRASLSLAEELKTSSLHWLFTPPDETAVLEAHGLLRRAGFQFHWHNRDYAGFDDFLAGLSSEKRKKIKRERRHVHEAGISLEVLNGDQLEPRHWDVFYEFYQLTIRKHGAIPYLTPEFFHRLGATMADNIVLVLARHHSGYVGAALNLRGSDALYGRYWGGDERYNSLHFETCYYRPVEYCIENGLQRFEAGAQGEHKLARGFLPAATCSAHWLSHPVFFRAVEDFLARERNGVAFHMTELNEHSPFKSGC
jgi:hypothetical protein